MGLPYVNQDYNALPPGFGTRTDPNFDRSYGMNGGYNSSAGGGGVSVASPGAAQIQTSIMPQSIFSRGLTQRTMNQAVADRQRTANPVYAQKQFDAPGKSRDAGTQYRSAPMQAQAMTDAALASAQIPWNDEAANQQFMLQGQVARAGEFNSLADLLLKLQSLSNYSGQQNIAALAPIFALFGRAAG